MCTLNGKFCIEVFYHARLIVTGIGNTEQVPPQLVAELIDMHCRTLMNYVFMMCVALYFKNQ